MCIVFDGKYSRREAIHITLSEIAALCTILGFAYATLKEAIAFLRESEPSAATDDSRSRDYIISS